MANNAFRLFAGLEGTNIRTVGSDDSVYQYQTLADAVSAAKANDTIVLAPETHTVSALLTIDKPLRFVGLSDGLNGCKVTSSATLATAMFSVELAARDSDAYVVFEDIYFSHAVTGYNVFGINNTSVAQDLYVKFRNCSVLVYPASATYGVAVSQASSSNLISLDMSSGKLDSVSTVYFDLNKATDALRLVGLKLREEGNAAGVITSTDTNAATLELHRCMITTSKGVSGGASQQLLKSYFCYTPALKAQDAVDFIGSQTATVVGT